jgi:hypothetical protein
VNDIHKRGGTIIGSSRGGHDTSKIVDSIQDRGINQVYIMSLVQFVHHLKDFVICIYPDQDHPLNSWAFNL